MTSHIEKLRRERGLILEEEILGQIMNRERAAAVMMERLKGG
jgi:hypothetical protein